MPIELNWLDYVGIVILLICAVDGLLKGFVISVFNIAGFFVSVYAAKVMASSLAKYLSEEMGLYAVLNKYIQSKVSGFNTTITFVVNLFGGSTINSGNALTTALILILAFLIVFLCARIIITIIGNTLDVAARLPVLKQFNKTGGLVFGILKGILILYVVFALLTPLIPLLKLSNPLISGLEQSVFTANFYKYNLIIPWIKGNII